MVKRIRNYQGGRPKRSRTFTRRRKYGRRGAISRLRRLVFRQFDTKHVDSSLTDASVNYTTPTVKKLSSISQGDTDIARDGNRVYFKNLFLDYAVSVPTDAPPNMGSYRIVLVQWKLDDAVLAPLWTSVFTANSVRAMYLSNSSNFRILYDREFTWTYPERNAHRHFKHFIKILQRQVKYADAGDTGIGQLYFMAISSLAASGPAIVGNARLQFTG